MWWWWERFTERVDPQSIQNELQERHPIKVSLEDIARLSAFITDCAVSGAEFAQFLDDEHRAVALADDHEGIRKVAPQYVTTILMGVAGIDWLGQDFAQDLGKVAFEQGFVRWCEWVIDSTQPPQS